ncbi:Starch-binding associating with outer membrane [Sphingobacterium nematocida]|uniref:Starch-binding associating with outer membrane n=1 Tax=Sphingobacterium nematocida TaxID=1513896 RepID=A0A1T5GH23_9SPHI|nr:RagB/SusD family nutrient uptake outer membrane protein [Sphingobacterium nematocida]SKC07701.1 Starch-binding associating with outer membrane [Sphingobacterium nematocida]
MKIKAKILKFICGLFLIQVTFSGCSKQLDIVSGEVSSETLQWTSISDTKSSLIGMYALLRASMLENNSHWMYGELRSGDFISYNRQDLKAINEGNLKAAHPLIKDLTNWRRFYAVINAASVFIERAPEVMSKDSRYTEVNLKLDIAQAKAIRAFTYFYMVRIWGDVPLLSKSFDDGVFEHRPRTAAQTVLNFAESEILSVIEDLPYSYGIAPTSYYGENSGYWRSVLFNKLTGYSILAHISAWQGKYINVDTYTKFIIDNYASGLLTYITSIGNLSGLSGVFSNNYAAGQLFSIPSPYIYGEASATGHIEELTLAYPIIAKQKPDIYVPKDTIVEVFNDINDTRFGIDTVSGLTRTNYFTNYSGEIPLFSKIKILRDGESNGAYAVYGSNLIFTRLEEIALLRAEALAVLGVKDEAISLLNRIKANRKVQGYSVVSTTPLIDEIFNERRRELMGEGWRWYDQVRHNRLKAVSTELVDLIAKDGIYWPISNDVLRKNKELEQNNYWK